MDNCLKKEFKYPGSRYRSCPFWAWNTRLDKEELCRQIDIFKKMGFGGFYMHSRIGLDTDYLGDEYMDAIRTCVAKAKGNDMFAELYDDDLWPSGIAGGAVTDTHPEYRKKALLLSVRDYSNNKSYELFGRYLVEQEGGRLIDYKRLSDGEFAEGQLYYAYIYTVPDRTLYDTPPYSDVLDKEGVELFIKSTHDKYSKHVGDEFGKAVRTIFTDEPTIEPYFYFKPTSYNKLYLDDEYDEVNAPWTRGLEDILLDRYEIDIKEKLPEIFFELGDGHKNLTRYYFRMIINQLFCENYFGQIYDWCQDHGIDSTGHILFEETLELQGRCSGDPMLMYSKFHIPGMDLLRDAVEYNTAKQVQSVVRQMNKKGMMSELYGVTGWDFDFRRYKFQGDWQAALGVTLRVPHLSWLSMEGGAKRDYPASIGVQSPWWEEYSYLEDHFARVNSVMTRGKSVVNIGVIHPVESYLVSMGPNSITSETRRRLDENFSSNAKLLLESGLDFDYISESLIATESDYKSALTYGAIVVSGAVCLRKTTVDFLADYQNKGGKVIFIGEKPYCIDGDDEELLRLYDASYHKETDNELISSLEEKREVDIKTESGRKMVYQLRREDNKAWFFAAFSEKCGNEIRKDNTRIRIKGAYKPTLFNTLSGDMTEIGYSASDGWTEIELSLYNSDSVLLMLDSEVEGSFAVTEEASREVFEEKKCSCTDIEAQELNLILLDSAEYSFDGVEYFDKKNILKIDHEFRNKIHIPFRWNRDRSQPWKSRSLGEIVHDKYLYLRFKIESEIEYDGAYLALEGLERTEVTLNGEAVDTADKGYYVDKSIRKIALPKIVKGENIIELKIKIIYSNIKGAEYCYLLGDFGVEVDCDVAKIVPKCSISEFASIRELKMPFYGGNITYNCCESFENDCRIAVKVPEYIGAAVRVYLDGVDKGIVCFAPYTLDLGEVKKGEHTVSFKLYGNRHNTFGALHCKNDSIGEWPELWFPNESSETNEYLFKDVGIVDIPVILCMN